MSIEGIARRAAGSFSIGHGHRTHIGSTGAFIPCAMSDYFHAVRWALRLYSFGLRWCLRNWGVHFAPFQFKSPVTEVPLSLTPMQGGSIGEQHDGKRSCHVKSIEKQIEEAHPVTPPSSPDFLPAEPDKETQLQMSLVSFVLEEAQSIDEHVLALVADTESALLGGGGLNPIVEGVGGSYIVHTASGMPIAVFKPENEEVGAQFGENSLGPNSSACAEHVPTLRDITGSSTGVNGVNTLPTSVRYGCLPGWGARRECAAYCLDRLCPSEYRAGVPPTAYVSLRSSLLTQNTVGSLQRWIQNDGPSEDWGPSRFDRTGARNIAILDLRILNLDRHAANVLVRRRENELLQLCPIDHGYSLPHLLVGEGPELAWDMWDACQVKLDAGTINCLRELASDAGLAKSASLLRNLGFSEDVVRTTALATLLLYEAASAGLTLHQIASLMRQARVRGGHIDNGFGQQGHSGVIEKHAGRGVIVYKSIGEQLHRKLLLCNSFDRDHVRSTIRDTIGRWARS